MLVLVMLWASRCQWVRKQQVKQSKRHTLRPRLAVKVLAVVCCSHYNALVHWRLVQGSLGSDQTQH